MRIHLDDLPPLIDLATEGILLVFKLAEADALARGKTEITSEDLANTKLKLTHVLNSGRTVGELRERLQEIAESG